MAFARTETTILNHPKFVGLDPAALGLWTLGNAYCWDQLTDGFISAAALTRLLSWVPPRRVRVLANVLANATARGRYDKGLWERVADGFLVHDWHQYNPPKEEILARREAEKVRMKQRRAAKRTPERPAEHDASPAERTPGRTPGRTRQDVDVDSPPIVPPHGRPTSDPRIPCRDGAGDLAQAWHNPHEDHQHTPACATPAAHAGWDRATGRYAPLPKAAWA